ncbi:MAG: hypothetical protein ABSF46_13500 [Terriglobia bacterium]|jgi:hypothetical protein
MSDEEKHDWDRQPGESSKAYAHFCLYRDTGFSRSLRKLAEDAKCISKVAQLRRWSSRWKWVERCEKYDDYLENQDRLQQEKERREMRKRHARMGVLGQSVAVKALENLLNKVRAGGEVSAGDAGRLLDTAVKVERLARGEPTDSHEVSGPGGGPIEFANMSDGERRAEMIRCLKEMGKTNEDALAIAAQLMGDNERV